MYKMNKRYYLLTTSHTGRYDCTVAVSDSLLGPYSERYVAIPSGGHNVLFKGADGQLYSTFFGTDEFSPFREHAAFLKIKVDENGFVIPVLDSIISKKVDPWRYTMIKPSSDWTTVGL